MNDRLPELPLDPEDWPGTPEWELLSDEFHERMEAMKEYYADIDR